MQSVAADRCLDCGFAGIAVGTIAPRVGEVDVLGLKRRTSSADRQTIIALRATHTAMRVARDVAYPELPLPIVREDAAIFSERPILDYDPSPQMLRYYRPSEFQSRHFWLFIGMLLLAIILPFLIAAF